MLRNLLWSVVMVLTCVGMAAAEDEKKCKPALGDEPRLCLLQEIDGRVEYLLDVSKNERYDEWPQNLVYKNDGDFFLDIWMVAFDVKTPDTRTYYARTLHFHPNDSGGYNIKDFLSGVCLVVDGKEAGHKSVTARWEPVDESFPTEHQSCRTVLQYYQDHTPTLVATPL